MMIGPADPRSRSRACSVGLIERREGIDDDEVVAGERQLEHAVGEVRGAVEGAVTGRDVDVARFVDRRPLPRHPDAAVERGRRRREGGALGERRRVVGEQPAVIRLDPLVRGERDVEHAVEEQERGALQRLPRHERRRRRLHDLDGRLPRRAGHEVERPEHLVEVAEVAALRIVGVEGDDVERLAGGVDDRRAGDAELGHEDLLVEAVERGGLPSEVCHSGAAGVLASKAKTLSCSVATKSVSCVRERAEVEVGHVERLRVDLAVDGQREEEAEARAHDLGRQHALGEVGAGARVVVVLRQHAHARRRRARRRVGRARSVTRRRCRRRASRMQEHRAPARLMIEGYARPPSGG